MDIKQKFLPSELKPTQNPDTFIIIEYPESTIGSYNEVIIVLSCKYKDKPGGVSGQPARDKSNKIIVDELAELIRMKR